MFLLGSVIAQGRINDVKKNEFNPIPDACAKGFFAKNAYSNVPKTAAIIVPT